MRLDVLDVEDEEDVSHKPEVDVGVLRLDVGSCNIMALAVGSG